MIECKNLTVTFPGGITALEQFSLRVPQDENTVVIGETGSGKSVMLSAIMRILPPSARVTGEILLDGRNLLSLKEREMNALRGRRLAYIPQGGGSSMNPLLTVGDQVAEPLMEKNKVRKKNALNAAREWLAELRLGDPVKIAASYPHTLSGGMRQRALIAMGAITGAPLLLADEPTKGLDGQRVDSTANLLLSLKGRTILCVSHDLGFARRIAQHICVLYASQSVEECRCEDFFQRPLHPYSQMLLASLPENGLQAELGFAPPHGDTARRGCRFYDRCPRRSARCAAPPPVAEVNGRKVRCWLYAD